MKESHVNRCRQYFETHARGHMNSRNIGDIEAFMFCDNRTARAAINELRTTHGMPIVSLSDGTGYFLMNKDNPEDVAKASHFVAEVKARIRELGEIMAPVKKEIDSVDQPPLLPGGSDDREAA